MDNLNLVLTRLMGYYLDDLTKFEKVASLNMWDMMLSGALLLPVYLFKWWILSAPVWLPLVMCLNSIKRKPKHERDKSAAIE